MFLQLVNNSSFTCTCFLKFCIYIVIESFNLKFMRKNLDQ